MLQLNRSNYHSLEANREYMSRSMYEKFLECEAQAMAMLKCEWSEEPTTELLVGSYVHSWNDGTIRDFMANTPAMFTQKLELRAPFKVADKMIETLKNDELIMYLLNGGQKEVIFTAEMFGCWWKIMIDSYNSEDRRSIDLKTTRSITDHVWSEEDWAKVSFVEKYKYPLQSAIYSEVERIANGRPDEDWFNFYITAVSKDEFPDKEVISMVDPDRYRKELAQVEANMPRILGVKAGEVEPFRCERCDYCRSTKKLSEPIRYSLL